MLNDLRFALRVIRKYPLSNAVIVFTIACLVAVIGLMFASFRMNMGRQMPFADPDRFVRFWRVSKHVSIQQMPSDIYNAYQEQLESYSLLGALDPHTRFTLTGAGEATTLTAVRCTATVMEMTGMKPLKGRFFSATDEEPGNRRIVVLSEESWNDYFASDPDILGKEITLNDEAYTVVGIAPKALQSTHLAWGADLWMPYNWTVNAGDNPVSLNIVARIRPDRTLTEAQTELSVIAPRIEEERPDYKNEVRWAGTSRNEAWTAKVARLDKYLRQGRQSTEQVFAMVFAFTLMGCVVLIACFNMTNLFLVQATSRAREMAVRLSVGASRGRIVRQMLLESVTLSFLGGIAGLLVSFWLLKLGEAEALELRFDPYLYATGFGSAIIIGALVSILPAWRAGKADLSIALKDGGQSSATRQRHRLRNFLVGSQVAMATILTVAAVLFGRSLLHTYLTPLRFDTERLIAVTIDAESRLYKGGDAVSRLANEALRVTGEMPGVEGAAITSTDITSGWSAWNQARFRDDSINPSGEIRTSISYVSRDFCQLIGMSVREGRGFSENRAEALNEAVINETFARSFFPEGTSPIGEEFLLNETRVQRDGKNEKNQVWVTIVGIVQDRNPRLVVRDQQPALFVSAFHPFNHSHRITVLVETKADAKKFGLAVRETLKRLNASQPVGAFTTVHDIIERHLKPRRVSTYVFLGMAGFGILMALMGVYGVVAYAVIERTREMGIRMALGATRTMVVKMIMTEGTRLLLRGLIPGILIAYAVTHGVPKEMVQHVSPRDPVTYLAALLAIGLCGSIAALLPARRMVKLNPGQALHYE